MRYDFTGAARALAAEGLGLTFIKQEGSSRYSFEVVELAATPFPFGCSPEDMIDACVANGMDEDGIMSFVRDATKRREERNTFVLDATVRRESAR